VGFPIRKFLDQSPFAAPQDLSQRTTSFIASQHQGIHRIPLRHLIAHIIDAHPSSALRRSSRQRSRPRFPRYLLHQAIASRAHDHTECQVPVTELGLFSRANRQQRRRNKTSLLQPYPKSVSRRRARRSSTRLRSSTTPIRFGSRRTEPAAPPRPKAKQDRPTHRPDPELARTRPSDPKPKLSNQTPQSATG
jgi:hypothetical protein